MVHHTCSSPLEEVLGSFASSALCGKSRVSTGSLGTLPVCALIWDVILHEFWS